MKAEGRRRQTAERLPPEKLAHPKAPHFPVPQQPARPDPPLAAADRRERHQLFIEGGERTLGRVLHTGGEEKPRPAEIEREIHKPRVAGEQRVRRHHEIERRPITAKSRSSTINNNSLIDE